MLLNPFTFYTPKTVREAAELFSRHSGNVRLQAGGTFLFNSLKLMKRNGTKTPEHVISLSKIPELKGISLDAKQMTIKSMTTIDELFLSKDLVDNFQVFKIVCKDISTQPIRNVATVGGNLTCRYTWTEMPAVMVGLEAKMHFIGADGKEEVLDAEDFYKNNAKTDKIFSHVTIARDAKCKIAYRRVKKTVYVDIPLLSFLIKAHVEGNAIKNARVAVNNCVAFAQRDKKLEDFLNSTPISDKLPAAALEHVDAAIYDNRSSDYKKHMFRVSIKNAVGEIIKK